MTKDDAVQLGIASHNARQHFVALGAENTSGLDLAQRADQVLRYERARADMHEAMNRHHAALEQLGLLPS